MGDRCWLQLHVSSKDRELFAEAFVGSWGFSKQEAYDFLYNPKNGVLSPRSLFYDYGEVEEANYGWYSELEKAATLGVTFVGFSGPGDSYGPGAFVGFNKDFAWVDTLEGGEPIISFRDIGKERAIQRIHRYLTLAYIARKALRLT